MEIIHGNEEILNEEIRSGLVLVDFFATWCGPCKMLGPVLEEIKDEIKIVKIDVDECESLARFYGIMSVPTMILFKDGQMIDKKNGFVPKEELLNWIQKEFK